MKTETTDPSHTYLHKEGRINKAQVKQVRGCRPSERNVRNKDKI